MAQRHHAQRSAQRLVECHQQISLHVRAALGEFFRRESAAAKAVRAVVPAAEHLLEKITEAGAAEVELLPGAVEPAAPARAAGRRPELRALLPVRAQLVVFLPLGRIAQNLVGLVDLLEFLFRLLFVFGHVRVVLARELAEGFFNFVLARAARDAEHSVVVFEFHTHNAE